MKKLLGVGFLFLSLLSYGDGVDFIELEKRDEKYYYNGELYTGNAEYNSKDGNVTKKLYIESGFLRREESFKDGIGIRKLYYKNGNLADEMLVESGEGLARLWKIARYSEDGKKMIEENKLTGETWLFYENGGLQRYSNSLKEIEESYDEEGNLIEK